MPVAHHTIGKAFPELPKKPSLKTREKAFC